MPQRIDRMRFRPAFAVCFAVILAASAVARGQDLLPPESPPEQAIDHYVNAKLQAAGVSAAAQADDANLLRRTLLDLVGRIPATAEAKAYITDPAPDKRVQLVDRLMA